MLLVPQPRLRTGFFSVLNPSKIEPRQYSYAVTQAGVVQFGEPIDLDAKIKVDMIVMGSVAVNPANGARIGKGEGFAELEYGMLRIMGAIDDDTPVVTCIHDCQLVDDIPSEKMLCHDVAVDIICTPTRIIRVPRSIPKPQGIYWDVLSPQKLAAIKVLQVLKARLEAALPAGERLPCGPDEVLPPTAARGGADKGGKGAKGGKGSNAGKSPSSGGRWSGGRGAANTGGASSLEGSGRGDRAPDATRDARREAPRVESRTQESQPQRRWRVKLDSAAVGGDV